MTIETFGLVLAGGLARRMGGGDKPLRRLADRTILARIVALLAPQVAATAISANGAAGRFAAFGLPVIPDPAESKSAGPLSGILAGLRWTAAETPCQRMLSVAGDTPFFPNDLAQRLQEAVDGYPQRIAIASSKSRRHPVFALWTTALAEPLAAFLAHASTTSVAAFLATQDCVDVSFEATSASGVLLDPFFNINTPDDLAEAERLLQDRIL